MAECLVSEVENSINTQTLNDQCSNDFREISNIYNSIQGLILNSNINQSCDNQKLLDDLIVQFKKKVQQGHTHAHEKRNQIEYSKTDLDIKQEDNNQQELVLDNQQRENEQELNKVNQEIGSLTQEEEELVELNQEYIEEIKQLEMVQQQIENEVYEVQDQKDQIKKNIQAQQRQISLLHDIQVEEEALHEDTIQYYQIESNHFMRKNQKAQLVLEAMDRQFDSRALIEKQQLAQAQILEDCIKDEAQLCKNLRQQISLIQAQKEQA